MFDKIIFEKIMKWSENRPQPKGLTNETIKKVSDYFKEKFEKAVFPAIKLELKKGGLEVKL